MKRYSEGGLYYPTLSKKKGKRNGGKWKAYPSYGHIKCVLCGDVIPKGKKLHFRTTDETKWCGPCKGLPLSQEGRKRAYERKSDNGVQHAGN